MSGGVIASDRLTELTRRMESIVWPLRVEDFLVTLGAESWEPVSIRKRGGTYRPDFDLSSALVWASWREGEVWRIDIDVTDHMSQSPDDRAGLDQAFESLTNNLVEVIGRNGATIQDGKEIAWDYPSGFRISLSRLDDVAILTLLDPPHAVEDRAFEAMQKRGLI